MDNDLIQPVLGIIGGAGPMAGALLLQKVIRICQEKYNCREDDEFPYMVLLSYPFADSLLSEDHARLVKRQLADCFRRLDKNGTRIVGIACNTLHEYLPEEPYNFQFVHMIEETAKVIDSSSITESFVLCSMTAARCKLHQKFFNCLYPDQDLQLYVYNLMNKILAGKYSKEDSMELVHRLNSQLSQLENTKDKIGLVLGCTEFSVLNNQFPLDLYGIDKRFKIFDTNQILAEKMCELIFLQ